MATSRASRCDICGEAVPFEELFQHRFLKHTMAGANFVEFYKDPDHFDKSSECVDCHRQIRNLYKIRHSFECHMLKRVMFRCFLCMHVEVVSDEMIAHFRRTHASKSPPHRISDRTRCVRAPFRTLFYCLLCPRKCASMAELRIHHLKEHPC